MKQAPGRALFSAFVSASIGPRPATRPIVIAAPRAQLSSMPNAPAPQAQEIRDAGPEAMPDPPPDWDEVDEASDQSFPASDPAPNHPR